MLRLEVAGLEELGHRFLTLAEERIDPQSFALETSRLSCEQAQLSPLKIDRPDSDLSKCVPPLAAWDIGLVQLQAG